MKKIISVLFLLCSVLSFGQINLATTLRQDTQTVVLRQIRSAVLSSGTSSSSATSSLQTVQINTLTLIKKSLDTNNTQIRSMINLQDEYLSALGMGVGYWSNRIKLNNDTANTLRRIANSRLTSNGGSVADHAYNISAFMDDGGNGAFITGSGNGSVFKVGGQSIPFLTKQSSDTTNQELRSTVAQLGGVNTRLDTYLSSGGTGIGTKSDSIVERLRILDWHINGVNITPQVYSPGVESWGEANLIQQISTTSEIQTLSSKITNGSNVAAGSVPVVLATDVTPTVMTIPGSSFTGTTCVNSASFTPVATASLIARIKPLKATGLRVNWIKISGTQTTGGNVVFKLLSLTAAPSGGSPSNLSDINIETGNAEGNPGFNWYTGTPTGITVAGTQAVTSRAVIHIPAPGATYATPEYVWRFGEDNLTPRYNILTSGNNSLAIAMEGVTLTGGILQITVCYTYY